MLILLRLYLGIDLPIQPQKNYTYTLIALQKKFVRTMSRSAFDAHTDPLFKKFRNSES